MLKHSARLLIRSHLVRPLRCQTLGSQRLVSSLAQQDLGDRFAFENFSDKIKRAALILEDARKIGTQIEPLTNEKEYEFLDQSTAYDIAAAACGMRVNGGATAIGRKFGFTNQNIWYEYSVDEPNWSYLYDQTVQEADSRTTVDLKPVRHLQPRIEPEIAMGLVKAPTADMDEIQLLSCVGWLAHSFEVVVSLFPDWKFKGTDTTAAYALHHCLLVGPGRRLDNERPSKILLSQLESFEIDLCCNGTVEDIGHGSNVLGSPIKALQHIVKLLAQQDRHPQLTEGEIVTTGTLTRALPISTGDRWHTELRGINLPGLDVQFEL